jgi:hypothetical protein
MPRQIKVGDRVHIPWNAQWEGKLPKWFGRVKKIEEREYGGQKEWWLTVIGEKLGDIRGCPASHVRWAPQNTEKR